MTKHRKNSGFSISGILISAICALLLLLNAKTVDKLGTGLVVRLMESSLLENSINKAVRHSEPSASFKYFRMRFGGFISTRRWVVYDESGQVSINYQERNSEWWKVSKENEEGESCMTNGERLYSNFYVQYSGC